MSVKPIPEGYHSVTPYLIIKGAGEALEFYKKAFGATEVMRMACPDTGKIMHAEIKVGDSILMLGDECPEMGYKGPQGASPVGLMIYVPDVDARFAKALEAGGTVQRPVQDQFYGDRSGTLVDPYGHVWTISTHIEDVSFEECARRAQESMKKAS